MKQQSHSEILLSTAYFNPGGKGGGGGGTPYNSLYGEAPPKMVTFFRFSFGSKNQRYKIEGPDPTGGSNQL